MLCVVKLEDGADKGKDDKDGEIEGFGGESGCVVEEVGREETGAGNGSQKDNGWFHEADGEGAGDNGNNAGDSDNREIPTELVGGD